MQKCCVVLYILIKPRQLSDKVEMVELLFKDNYLSRKINVLEKKACILMQNEEYDSNIIGYPMNDKMK